MNIREQKAKEFKERWKGRGNEKSESQSFWLELLHDVFDVERPTEYIKFEKPVKEDTTQFVDARIYDTKVIIEQKSLGIDLTKPERQSDGSLLSPVDQARRYAKNIYDNEGKDAAPEWLVACNFEEFHIYDLKVNKGSNKIIIKLSELDKQCYNLEFLVKHENIEFKKEMQLSFDAGKLVGKLYDAIKPQYKNPDNPETLKSLNILCVRLVFCLYAEDSGLFGKSKFTDYFKTVQIDNFGKTLKEFFKVLNTEESKRDPYENKVLNSFPYINGGLFVNENVEIPNFTEDIRKILIKDCGDDFDWSGISPTIFGAIFESTLNPEIRHDGGMHYTTLETIHKVIDPLFLVELKNELAEIKEIRQKKNKDEKLRLYWNKLSSLKFLDPASGSGNFLTETYMQLRLLENEVITLLYGIEEHGPYIATDRTNLIKISLNQFYGIEINDFAVDVSLAALWIAEHQMLKKTEDIVRCDINMLPLKSHANIINENALKTDWDSVTGEKVDYVIGNPPFLGARMMNESQKMDMISVFGNNWKNVGDLDYVCGWYKKSLDYIKNTNCKCAFVSTNSICQGSSVGDLWKPLFENGIEIIFAHRTFKWDSKSNEKAVVFCVVVGFRYNNTNSKIVKRIFDGDLIIETNSINGYLDSTDNISIESRSEALCNIPRIGIGNQPIDDGNYLFTEKQMIDFVKEEPEAKKYFKLWYGSDEFINNKKRYCLWLGDCNPSELRRMPKCLQRVENVKKFRLSSKRSATKKLAEKPTHFQTENMPKSNYILIPEVSTSNRRYIPIGFMSPDALCSNLVKLIPNATLYHFSILISNVHMAWMRMVCGRLGTGYRYSKEIVYNNFPWPIDISVGEKKLSDKDKALIKKGYPTVDKKIIALLEKTGKAILDARNIYKDSSLADLYDPLTMPKELSDAHILNNKAVGHAYNFVNGEIGDESKCVSRLFELYKLLITV